MFHGSLLILGLGTWPKPAHSHFLSNTAICHLVHQQTQLSGGWRARWSSLSVFWFWGIHDMQHYGGSRERMGCFSVPKVVYLQWTEGINVVAMIGRIIPRKVENIPSSQVLSCWWRTFFWSSSILFLLSNFLLEVLLLSNPIPGRKGQGQGELAFRIPTIQHRK